MLLQEHIRWVLSGNLTPRVVEYNTCTSRAAYIAWTPLREGPARPDYAAALADLNDMIFCRKV